MDEETSDLLLKEVLLNDAPGTRLARDGGGFETEEEAVSRRWMPNKSAISAFLLSDTRGVAVGAGQVSSFGGDARESSGRLITSEVGWMKGGAVAWMERENICGGGKARSMAVATACGSSKKASTCRA